MSSTSPSKQQQQQQQRRRINNTNSPQSRNGNAYFDRDEYYHRSLIRNNNYWNHDYHPSHEEFYTEEYYPHHRNVYPVSSQRSRKGRQMNTEPRYHSKSTFVPSPNNNHHSYYDNIPPRHRLQQQVEAHSTRPSDSKTQEKVDGMQSIKLLKNDEQSTKPSRSASSSSTNSDLSNQTGTKNRKDLQTQNLASAAVAARQQTSQPQTQLSAIQTLMNSLILQQQQQQQPGQSQSTVQLQCQLTNALLATSNSQLSRKENLGLTHLVIQQRLKETALQVQAQQIQAALPTLLAAQALVYQQQQQQGQLIIAQQQPNLGHPGTKFNNRPLVKYPVVRPTIPPLPLTMMMPVVRPGVPTNASRHRFETNNSQTCSTTALPTYQQVQEIERGISLDEAIHLKNAVDINDGSTTAESERIPVETNE